MMDKTADLAGPGISTYEEVAKILPRDYDSLLTPKETMQALYGVKNYIEENLCKELNLMMVQVPLIVDRDSGVNRTPVEFPCGLGLEKRMNAQIVQAATKWKRMALKTFGLDIGEGLCTDMKAIRKDYFLDHDHSAYVDQWDWEKAISDDQRNLDYLTDSVRRIWKVLVGPRKQRETRLIQECPAVFIYGIGWPLADGYPHELRAADYDDWVTETESKDGRPMHGLNGDILVYNHVTGRRHELTSMGVRVTKETLLQQLELSDQMDLVDQPYHQAILNDQIPLSIGGGIGQSRVYMLLLRKAHLGEVGVTIWPKELRDICTERNIHVLQ